MMITTIEQQSVCCSKQICMAHWQQVLDTRAMAMRGSGVAVPRKKELPGPSAYAGTNRMELLHTAREPAT